MNWWSINFVTEPSGTISIELKPVSGRRILLVYRDNGIGIDAGIDLRSAGSMGLSTVFSLVEYQLQGSVAYQSEHGLEWTISFDAPEIAGVSLL